MLPVSSHPQRSVGQTPAKSRSAYGVASDRVYICTQLPVVPVSSYLAFPSLPRKNHGSLFLLHFPGGLPRRTLSVILPYDARTFLTPIPYGYMARDSPICGIYYSINFALCQGKRSDFTAHSSAIMPPSCLSMVFFSTLESLATCDASSVPFAVAVMYVLPSWFAPKIYAIS